MLSFIVVGVLGAFLLTATLLGDGWVEDDGDVSSWLSPRAVAVFMVWYGAFGGLLYHSGRAELFWSSIFAVIWSVIATVFVVSAINWCVTQACTTTTGDVVGRKGTVSNVYGELGTMVVTTQVGELQEEFLAKSIEPVHEGDTVVIIDRQGSFCTVRRVAATV